MALQDFEALLKSLSPAMATLLLRGGVECLDSYNRARVITPGTAGIGLTWRRDKKGFYLGQEKSLTAGGGAISIVDSGAAPELRATSGTIFWTARSFQAPNTGASNGRIVSKRDAGGTAYEALVNNATITFGGQNMASATMVGGRSMAVRFVNGTPPSLFVDGVFRVVAGGNCSVSADDADLYLGNIYTLVSGVNFIDYGLFVIFNDAVLGRPITDQEIAALHDSWVSIISVFEPDRKILIPKPLIEVIGSSPVIEIAGDGKNAANIVPDRSGNGNDLTCSGGPLTQRSCCGRTIYSAYGKGGASGPLMQSPVNVALYPDPWTVVFRVFVRSVGENNAGHPFMIDTGSNRCRTYPNAGATLLYYLVSYSDGEAVWSFPCVSGVNHVIVLRHTKSNPANVPAVTVDGEAVVVTTVTPRAGVLNTAPNARVTLFDYYSPAAAARAFDGEISDFAIIDGYKTDAEARNLYLNHALRCNELANRTDDPVSLAAASPGVKCGPWYSLTGSQTWSDDGTRRRLLGVASGYFVSRRASPQAYGAWYFKVLRADDVGNVYVPLVLSVPKSLSDSAQNGYLFNLYNPTGSRIVAIRRITAGAGGNIIQVADANEAGVGYEVFITRTSVDSVAGIAGLFTLWMRGGAYTGWSLLGSAVNSTYTTSVCLVGFIGRAGSYISDYCMFPDGAGLEPNDVPWLKDTV